MALMITTSHKTARGLIYNRVYTPHLPAKIFSLRDLIEGHADTAVHIPSRLPAETPKSEAVNSDRVRYSDTPQHENLHSNSIPSIMSYTQYPFSDTLLEGSREKYGPKAPFRDRELVLEWVEGIFVHNGH